MPGKTFLLGEYAVLTGLPAVVATLGPRFGIVPSAGTATGGFTPGSPAGRLLEAAFASGPPPVPDYLFEDPYVGAGGFGASTAQFALLYHALAADRDWDRRWQMVWKKYRTLTSGSSGIAPSGADLAAQLLGGVTLFQNKGNESPAARDLWPLFDFSCALVFSATGIDGRKTATHGHLGAIKRSGIEELSGRLEIPLVDGITAIEAGDAGRLGKALTAYAGVLADAGFEHPGARDDRLFFMSQPDVLGAKGSGALLSDSIVVVIKPRSSRRAGLAAAAASRGLRLVADGITLESGIT
ncbi:MAG: hypothetical protein A2583_07030 [Bdellovibrionales bacterium RIFOXYD1_FULL_53_11]|nr:MAG: hypothetical protein A2583_07030 [Bdellovibrionales bacterium RIFOXYD1_FULL_53_11]